MHLANWRTLLRCVHRRLVIAATAAVLLLIGAAPSEALMCIGDTGWANNSEILDSIAGRMIILARTKIVHAQNPVADLFARK